MEELSFEESNFSVKRLPEHIVGRCVFFRCAVDVVCCRSFVFFFFHVPCRIRFGQRWQRETVRSFSNVRCAAVATPFLYLLEPRREPQTKTMLASVLDSSVCIGVLLADSNSLITLVWSESSGKWQEHPLNSLSAEMMTERRGGRVSGASVVE